MTSDKSNYSMSDAIEHGDVHSIKQRILSDPKYLHARDEDGDTPILLAACSSKLEIVELLIRHGANPNDCGNDGYNCLLMATESEEKESMAILKLLISAGASVLATGINGWTPLHMAASYGHVEKAKLFIDAGADIDQRTEIDGGHTPLMEAASRGWADVVRLLLENCADPSLRNHISRKSPLQMAQQGLQRVELAKLNNGQKNPDKKAVDYTEAIRILSEYTEENSA